jgi:hypothetical protein
MSNSANHCVVAMSIARQGISRALSARKNA